MQWKPICAVENEKCAVKNVKMCSEYFEFVAINHDARAANSTDLCSVKREMREMCSEMFSQ